MKDSGFSIQRQVDSICDEFDKQWSATERPDIKSFLDRIALDHRDQLLLMLLEIDVELRQKAGQKVSADDYADLGEQAITQFNHLLASDDIYESPPPNPVKLPAEGDELIAQWMSGKRTEEARTIGNYKLLKVIGEGGMGTVWMAEQAQPIKRKVALKVIKAGISSKEVITRFEAERQALSLMNHSNIARILDVGTTSDGQPYFAMELVEGRPLTNYCDDNRSGISERLKLFAEVCSGVQHAHQKGIIHRDLKPSNILVAMIDGKPVPKVIDFGLAKALESTQCLTEHSLSTGFGQTLGTLTYMSPEQASLDLVDIDTRTDIYSLGVILYELLTGSTPLDNDTVRGEAMLKVLELIRDKESPKPSNQLSTNKATLSSITDLRCTDSSSLNRMLVGDLDWVVGKALEKDRNRRYESASELAADIQRFLNNEPVIARPPSAVYRIRKFVRKNLAGVIAVGLLLTALVAGIAGTSVGLFRAVRAEAKAENRRLVAEDSATVAREQTQLALKSLESVIVEIQSGLKNVPGTGHVRRKLLQTALAQLREVSEKFAARGEIDRNTMLALIDLGDVFLRFGVDQTIPVEKGGGPLATARKLQQQAFGIAQTLATANPDDVQAQRDLSISRGKLGNVQLQSGLVTKSLESYQKSLEINKKVVAADPGDASTQRLLAISYDGLAGAQLRSSRLSEATVSYQKALEINKQHAVANPNVVPAQRNLSVSYDKLGDVSLRLGKFSEGLNFYRAAFEIKKSLAEADPVDAQKQRDLSISLKKLGDAMRRLLSLDQALDFYRQSLEIIGKVAKADPDNIQASRDLALALKSMIECLDESGSLSKSDSYCLQMLAVTQKIASADRNDIQAQRDLAISHGLLGDYYLAVNRGDKAIQSFQQSESMFRLIAAKDENSTLELQNLATSISRVGIAYNRLENFGDACSKFEETVRIQKQLLEQDPGDALLQEELAYGLSHLGDVYFRLGKHNDGLNCFEQCLEIRKRLVESDSSDVVKKYYLFIAHANLGMERRDMGDFEGSLREFDSGMIIVKALQREGRNGYDLDKMIENLKEDIKKSKQAALIFGDWEEFLKQPFERIPELLERRALFFSQRGKHSDAVQAATRMLEIEGATGDQLYNTACVFSIAARAMRPSDTGGSISGEQLSMRDENTAKAMRALRAAIDAGFKDSAHIQQDKDLTILRDLSEFQKLMEELKNTPLADGDKIDLPK